MDLYYWLARTMLIERLLGVAVYTGLLLIMCLCVRSAKSYRSICRALNVYIVLLCIMAFFYIPGQDADLYRWRDLFDEYWASVSISEFAKSYLLQTETPVGHFIIYICSLTGIDGILPALCALIFYVNAFYILKNLYWEHQLSAGSISTALLFLMAGGGFLEVISGVRCFVSLSILARCFYDEIYNEKPVLKNIVWEILAALIHSMAAVIFIGRFFFSVFKKNRRPIGRVLNIALTAVMIIAVFRFGTDYVIGALTKAERYLTGEIAYVYSWEYVIGILMVLQFVIVLVRAGRIIKKNPNCYKMQNLFRLNLAVLVLEVVLAFEYNMFHRLVLFSTLTMIPLTAEVVENARNRNLERIIQFVSLLILLVACARGNLSGYKFMLLT